MTEFKSNAETLNSTPENSTAPELHSHWCGGDCTGRFDLIHVPGRNATVCKGLVRRQVRLLERRHLSPTMTRPLTEPKEGTGMDEQPRCIHRCVKVTDNGICDWCTGKTEEALEAMAGLYDQVREKLLESQASIVGDRVSGTRERPLGLSVDALSFIGPANDPTSPMRADYRDQHGPPPMLDTLGSWTRLVVEELDSKALVVHTAEGLASFLLIHHDWARKQPWADDYAEEIRQCAHEAKRLCGLYDARPTALDMVMCKRCEAFALVKVPGSRWAAECTGEIRNDRGDADLCGKLYTEQEYTDWVKLNAAYAKSKGKTA